MGRHDEGARVRVVRVETVAKCRLLQSAMKGKKRKGADEPRQPKPKVATPSKASCPGQGVPSIGL
ncbi:hypothetical protein HaLaN_22675, partial [Haematococcus lacustris]